MKLSFAARVVLYARLARSGGIATRRASCPGSRIRAASAPARRRLHPLFAGGATRRDGPVFPGIPALLGVSTCLRVLCAPRAGMPGPRRDARAAPCAGVTAARSSSAARRATAAGPESAWRRRDAAREVSDSTSGSGAGRRVWRAHPVGGPGARGLGARTRRGAAPSASTTRRCASPSVATQTSGVRRPRSEPRTRHMITGSGPG
jgi:hypothetical protein